MTTKTDTKFCSVATPVRIIRTRFIGPTNTRGARIKAWSVGDGNRPGFRLTIGYPYELCGSDCHEAAAMELHARIIRGTDEEGATVRILSCPDDGSGYLFVFLRR
jgi:hypothetical protein